LLLVLMAAPRREPPISVSGISTDLIQITSNFTGADIVVFGCDRAN
jgi:hypothetical protein